MVLDLPSALCRSRKAFHAQHEYVVQVSKCGGSYLVIIIYSTSYATALKFGVVYHLLHSLSLAA